MKRSVLYLKLTLALGKFVLLLFCFQRIFIKTFHLIKMTSTWWNEEQVDSSIISSHEYSMEAISLLCSSFVFKWMKTGCGNAGLQRKSPRCVSSYSALWAAARHSRSAGRKSTNKVSCYKKIISNIK